MRKTFLIFLCLVSLPLFLKAQNTSAMNNMENLFRMYETSAERGLKDVTSYLEGYLNPMMKGIGFGVSNGWYSTAKPHQLGGFDIQVTVSAAFIPDKDLFFTIDSLYEVSVVYPGDKRFPTLVGENSAPRFQHNTTGEYIDGLPGIDMEGTLDFSFIPVPMAQVGFGFLGNTDVKLRYVPKIKDAKSGVSFNMMGLGGMHDLKQYIPGADDMPFELSAFGGFTRMKMETDLSNAKDGSQLATFSVYSSTLQLTASKSVSIITGYVGFGATHSHLGLKVTGEYSTDSNSATLEIKDPLDLGFNAVSPKLTVGLEMKFLVLKIHFDYSLQQYQTVTGGVGITIR